MYMRCLLAATQLEFSRWAGFARLRLSNPEIIRVNEARDGIPRIDIAANTRERSGGRKPVDDV